MNVAPMQVAGVAVRPVVATRAVAVMEIAVAILTAADLPSHGRILVTHKAASHQLNRGTRRRRANVTANRAMISTITSRPATLRPDFLPPASLPATGTTSAAATAPVAEQAALAGGAMGLADRAAPARLPADKRCTAIHCVGRRQAVSGFPNRLKARWKARCLRWALTRASLRGPRGQRATAVRSCSRCVLASSGCCGPSNGRTHMEIWKIRPDTKVTRH